MHIYRFLHKCWTRNPIYSLPADILSAIRGGRTVAKMSNKREPTTTETLYEYWTRILGPIGETLVPIGERTVAKKKECSTCMGFGMWPDGTAPMGTLDAEDGMPTIACPECGADKNPLNIPEPVITSEQEFIKDITK